MGKDYLRERMELDDSNNGDYIHPFCNVALKSEDHLSKVADGFAVRLSLKAV